MQNLSTSSCVSRIAALALVVLFTAGQAVTASALAARHAMLASSRPSVVTGAPASRLADPEVVSFTLVNADTDLDIQTLTPGMTLNLATLPTRNLNIRANTNPATVGSVVFALSGAQVQNNTESVAPYSLFSDFQGDYFAWTPPAGSYTLTARPFSEASGGGTAGVALTLSFTVLDPTGDVTSFTLVNADTDLDIQTLTPGMTLNLATLPTRNLNIRANTNTSPIGSVVFALSGAQVQNLTESTVPYALFADFQGDYFAWTPPVGSYSLTATPYANTNGTGNTGAALTISFNVIDPTGTVSSFTLVNADTDLDIQTLTPGMTLNLATLPTRNLNIRANTVPATVGSVVFVMSGQAASGITENVVPYAMFGDVQGDYNPWTPATGSYTINATPFPAANGSGAAGTPLTVNFSVTDVAAPLPVELKDFTVQAQGLNVQVQWATASEKNNREFVVQRSLNGKDFTDLTTIPGQGSTNTAHLYTYLDKPLQPTPILYYRLRQVDTNGTATLSLVRTVTLKVYVSGLLVYPTVITHARLNYVLQSEWTASGYLELLNPLGQRVARYTTTGITSGAINTKDLPVGTYFLRFMSPSESFTRRFVIP